MHIDYKHDWYVDEDAWFIRFYLWLYEASMSDVNFCKLFWAYVFCVPVLVLRGMTFPFARLFHHIGSIERSRPTPVLSDRQKARSAKKWKKLQDKRGPAWPMRLLNRVGQGFATLLMAIERALGWIASNQQVNYVLGRALLGVGILAGTGGVGWVVYLAVINFSITVWALGFALGLALTVLFVLVLKAVGVFERLHDDVLEPVGGGIKKGGLGFGRVMAIGYGAVKSNTCPQIIVRGHEDESSDRVPAI